MENREVPAEPQPWEGRALPLHPPDEARQEMQQAIIQTLDDTLRQTSYGMVASQLSVEVARRAYEASEESNSPYKSHDVTLELSRMMGTAIRLAPNNQLFVNHEYIKRQDAKV